RAGGAGKQRVSGGRRPAGDLGGVMLVGRQEVGEASRFRSDRGQRLVVRRQVGEELLACDEELGRAVPGGVEQVPVAMGTEVMPLVARPPDDGAEGRVAEEPTGKEAGGPNPVAAQSVEDRLGAF